MANLIKWLMNFFKLMPFIGVVPVKSSHSSSRPLQKTFREYLPRNLEPNVYASRAFQLPIFLLEAALVKAPSEEHLCAIAKIHLKNSKVDVADANSVYRIACVFFAISDAKVKTEIAEKLCPSKEHCRRIQTPIAEFFALFSRFLDSSYFDSKKKSFLLKVAIGRKYFVLKEEIEFLAPYVPCLDAIGLVKRQVKSTVLACLILKGSIKYPRYVDFNTLSSLKDLVRNNHHLNYKLIMEHLGWDSEILICTTISLELARQIEVQQKSTLLKEKIKKKHQVTFEEGTVDSRSVNEIAGPARSKISPKTQFNSKPPSSKAFSNPGPSSVKFSSAGRRFSMHSVPTSSAYFSLGILFSGQKEKTTTSVDKKTPSITVRVTAWRQQ